MAPAGKSVKTVSKDGKKNVKRSKPKNRPLGVGVMRYSRSQMYKKKGLWRLKKVKQPAVAKVKKPLTVKKQIGGAKNGGERTVKLVKTKANYPTKERITKRPVHGAFSRHTRHTRPSLKVGRVLILVAGRHKGKRVVLMKVLGSGLLLVNGPFSINSCPMRRISQRYVIATQTRVKLGPWKVPEHINDAYFKRAAKKNANRGEGDIFVTKKEKYVPSEQKKKDQQDVDKAVIAAIKKNPDHKMLIKYLRNPFALRSTQFPHRLKF